MFRALAVGMDVMIESEVGMQVLCKSRDSHLLHHLAAPTEEVTNFKMSVDK